MTPDPKTAPPFRPLRLHGRGAVSCPDGRFETQRRETFDDGWGTQDAEPDRPLTELQVDHARRIISRNTSPDVPFEMSINPYRGCEHGCTYCYARPTHSYLGLSAGLDFETKIAYKADAAALLRQELAARNYRCSPIALGMNTDAWQPVERDLGITRSILEVLAEYRHPVTIVTKGAVIERDFDLLADLARDHLVEVCFSITTLDRHLARRMEPRAAAPQRRLELLRGLSALGVPAGVLFAPLIPALNDHEMENIFAAGRAAGARFAGYSLLRLPHELAEVFPAWLRTHAPERAEHVLSLLRQSHGGRETDSQFGRRMQGHGLFAEMYAKRARLAIARLGLNQPQPPLNTRAFRPPRPSPTQGELF